MLFSQPVPNLQSNDRAALTIGTRPRNPGLFWRPQLFTLFMWKWDLATVWCTFCRPHFPKVLCTPQFFENLKCKPSSRYSPVHFLSTTLPDRGAKPRKRKSYFGDPRSHFTRTKTQGSAPESIFTREFTRFRTFTLPYYLMMGGWLMMWLIWWWECWPWPIVCNISN